MNYDQSREFLLLISSVLPNMTENKTTELSEALLSIFNTSDTDNDTKQVQADWEEQDRRSESFINHKPDIANPDWSESDGNLLSFIKNKPRIPMEGWVSMYGSVSQGSGTMPVPTIVWTENSDWTQYVRVMYTDVGDFLVTINTPDFSPATCWAIIGQSAISVVFGQASVHIVANGVRIVTKEFKYGNNADGALSKTPIEIHCKVNPRQV